MKERAREPPSSKFILPTVAEFDRFGWQILNDDGATFSTLPGEDVSSIGWHVPVPESIVVHFNGSVVETILPGLLGFTNLAVNY